MKKFINSIIKKIKQKLEKPDVSHKILNGKLISGVSGKTSKRFFTSEDSLSIDSKQIFIKDEINAEAKAVLKEAINNPEVLVKFIKSKGTEVIKSRYMKSILFLFKEQDGFLPPMKGLKAFGFILLINTLSGKKLKPGFKTPALFALDDKPINFYILSHQFHMWLSYVNNLPGFDDNTRKNFKNIWDSKIDSLELSNLSVEELLSLKDAVARDTEATDFVREMTRELIGQKRALSKIKQGKRVNI